MSGPNKTFAARRLAQIRDGNARLHFLGPQLSHLRDHLINQNPARLKAIIGSNSLRTTRPY
jgi:hypothetical protein